MQSRLAAERYDLCHECGGLQDDYEAYKARTSVLVPLPPRR